MIASKAGSGPIPLRWRIFGLGSVLRPQRSLEKGPVIGDCSVELRLAISSHAQDEPETDRFFFGYLPFLLRNQGHAQNLAKLHRRFAKEGPQAAGGLATSGDGRPQNQRLEPDSQTALSHEPECGIGIGYAKNLYDGDRPVPITDGGQPITALFG